MALRLPQFDLILKTDFQNVKKKLWLKLSNTFGILNTWKVS